MASARLWTMKRSTAPGARQREPSWPYGAGIVRKRKAPSALGTKAPSQTSAGSCRNDAAMSHSRELCEARGAEVIVAVRLVLWTDCAFWGWPLDAKGREPMATRVRDITFRTIPRPDWQAGWGSYGHLGCVLTQLVGIR